MEITSQLLRYTEKEVYLTAPQIGYSKPVMVMAPQYVEPMSVRLKQAAKDARKREKNGN